MAVTTSPRPARRPAAAAATEVAVAGMADDIAGALAEATDPAQLPELAFKAIRMATTGTPGPVTSATPESYAAMFDTNVLGTLLSLKHELRVMQPQGAGTERIEEVLKARVPDRPVIRIDRGSSQGRDAIERHFEALGAQPGCRLARLSGSGATCFGLFTDRAAAQAAAAATLPTNQKTQAATLSRSQLQQLNSLPPAGPSLHGAAKVAAIRNARNRTICRIPCPI